MLRPATGGSSASADRIFYFFVDESFGLTKDTILHLSLPKAKGEAPEDENMTIGMAKNRRL
jgi:hypothetical protein